MVVSELKANTEEALRSALRILLDQIDYEEGACRPNEMIGAVLPVEVLRRCKNVLREKT
jgi:chorismate mutase